MVCFTFNHNHSNHSTIYWALDYVPEVFTHTCSLNHPNNPMKPELCRPPFAEKQTEARRREVTWPVRRSSNVNARAGIWIEAYFSTTEPNWALLSVLCHLLNRELESWRDPRKSSWVVVPNWEMILFPRRHLTVSEGIFGCHNEVEGRGACAPGIW